MNILETYWSGVLRRLQAEVDVFNKLIEHQGEKGQQNELSLARIIENFIPTRFGVGTGLVIDADGNYSSQTDIIIFNRSDEPALMAQSGQVLFPVENVRACIEVKTSASSDEISDAAEKFESVRRLNSRRPERVPVFAFLGYNAKTSAVALSSNFRSTRTDGQPDIACVLGEALVAGKHSAIHVDSESAEFVTGVTQLHSQESGRREPGRYYPAPEEWDDEPTVVVNGRIYPIVAKVNGFEMVGEPSRALLLFCDGLVRTILRSEGADSSVFSHYIPDVAREITDLASQ